jgi:hypothetical protein
MFLKSSATPSKRPRPHLVKVIGRIGDGSKRQVVIDRSKYPGVKLREIARKQLAAAKASEAR